MKSRSLWAILAILLLLSVPSRAEDAVAVIPRHVMALGEREHIFGSSGAKVTVIQYASLTCHSCRAFHMEVWPEVRRRYVDTGKIRFVVREFPLDPLATGAFMLARCTGPQKWADTVDLLYASDEQWAHAADPVAELHALMHRAGMGSEAFEDCLTNQALLDDVRAVAEGGTAAGVNATPTFFVNGIKAAGLLTIDQFAALVDPLLSREAAPGNALPPAPPIGQ